MISVTSVNHLLYSVDYGNGNTVNYKKAETYVIKSGNYVYIKKVSNDAVVIAVKCETVSNPSCTTLDELYTALYYITDCVNPDYNNALNLPNLSLYALKSGSLVQFLSTCTAAQFAALIEAAGQTGTGKIVFNYSPQLNHVKIGEQGVDTGHIHFKGVTAGEIIYSVPDNITIDYEYKLPGDPGAIGQALRNSAVVGVQEWFTPGTGTGDALTANPLSQFAATTSAQLAGVISDETGTGVLVFNIAPLLKDPVHADTADSTKRIVWSMSGMTTGVTLTITSTQSASRSIAIPVVGSGDSFTTDRTSSTFTGLKTFGDSSHKQINPAGTFSYTIKPSAITADRNLTYPLTRQDETFAVVPQIYQATPANPTGTANTTGLMMGLAGAITPQVTGRVRIHICGDIGNTTGDTGAQVRLRYGTGAAPANADAIIGTAAGGRVNMSAVASGSTTATVTMPFSLEAIVSGLTLGTAIWIDVDLAAVTGGTASIKNLSVTAFEV